MPSLFVSYAREDRRIAHWVVQGLTRRGWDVWIDEQSIRGAARWAGEIEAAIGRADAFLLLASSHAVTSPWVERELAAAADLRRPVVVAELESVPLPQSMQFLVRNRQRVAVPGPRGDDSGASQLVRLDDALIGAVEEAHGTRPDRVRLALGALLATVGGVGLLAGFGTFFFLLYQTARAEPFAADPDPSRFVVAMGIALVSGIVASVGAQLRRSARLRGVNWDQARRRRPT